MTGRRHSPVTFLFLLPAMSKNPHFFPKDSTSSVPLSYRCCFTVADLHTTCHVSPPPQKKNQPELDPPDRRLPVNIATETLLPSLSPPSLPPTGAMRARLCSYSLTWLQDWGKGSELTYGLLCIVGYGFQLVNTGTSWKIALVFSS